LIGVVGRLDQCLDLWKKWTIGRHYVSPQAGDCDLNVYPIGIRCKLPERQWLPCEWSKRKGKACSGNHSVAARSPASRARIDRALDNSAPSESNT
jgi:hypothetical protein